MKKFLTSGRKSFWQKNKIIFEMMTEIVMIILFLDKCWKQFHHRKLVLILEFECKTVNDILKNWISGYPMFILTISSSLRRIRYESAWVVSADFPLLLRCVCVVSHRIAPGSCFLTPGSWLLAPASWLLTPDSWLLTPAPAKLLQLQILEVKLEESSDPQGQTRGIFRCDYL